MRSYQTRILVLALVVALTACHAHVALATATSLKRSVENITQAPLDLALAPGVSAMVTVRNMKKCRRLLWPVCLPVGTLWHSGLNTAGATARAAGGILELPFALGFLFTSKDGPAFFDAEGVASLVTVPSRVYDVKFGLFHVED